MSPTYIMLYEIELISNKHSVSRQSMWPNIGLKLLNLSLTYVKMVVFDFGFFFCFRLGNSRKYSRLLLKFRVILFLPKLHLGVPLGSL